MIENIFKAYNCWIWKEAYLFVGLIDNEAKLILTQIENNKQTKISRDDYDLLRFYLVLLNNDDEVENSNDSNDEKDHTIESIFPHLQSILKRILFTITLTHLIIIKSY